jgi:hypothetical protein
MGRLPVLCAIALIAACRPAAREPPPPSNHDASPIVRARHANETLGLSLGATWHFHGTTTEWSANGDVTTQTDLVTRVVSEDDSDGRDVFHVVGWPGFAADQDVEIVIDHGMVTVAGDKWIALPPKAGAQICDDDETRYCWTVESAGKGFDVTYRTSPDVTTYHLEPGRGVTRFTYHHNGTTDDVDLLRSAE